MKEKATVKVLPGFKQEQFWDMKHVIELIHD